MAVLAGSLHSCLYSHKRESYVNVKDRWLTLAASGAVIPVAREAALAVAASRSGATQTTLGERMAGGARGSWPTFTPSTALTTGKAQVALLCEKTV